MLAQVEAGDSFLVPQVVFYPRALAVQACCYSPRRPLDSFARSQKGLCRARVRTSSRNLGPGPGSCAVRSRVDGISVSQPETRRRFKVCPGSSGHFATCSVTMWTDSRSPPPANMSRQALV